MASTREDVAHLLRRAGFGGSVVEIDRYTALGYEGAVDELLDLRSPDPGADAIPAPTFHTEEIIAGRGSGDEAAGRNAAKLASDDRRALVRWWIERMAATQRPLQEKLTFLWHDHFATSMDKVDFAEAMWGQNQTMRRLGAGRFDTLVSAVARDIAMLLWLDGHNNTAAAPNENFARELLELFTLGHGGTAHGGHTHGQPYTEADIRDAARASTGWVIDRAQRVARLEPQRHDGGTKTVLGETGPLGIDDIVRLATSHPACAPHVTARLYSRLARPVGPDDAVVKKLAAPFADDLDTTALLRRIFLHPDFRADATRVALVKTPLEYIIGTIRALGVSNVDEGVGRLLRDLGQVPFYPPNVAGWPENEAWLSTQTAMVRVNAAEALARRLTVPSVREASPSERPDAARHLLGVARWSDTTARALADASGDPVRMLTIALISPDYLLA